METFRRRLGLATALVSLMMLFAACEEDTAPVITKFRVTPECLNIFEHTKARVDENGQLVRDEFGNPIFDVIGTYAEVQYFARASGGNEESDPTGGNTPLTWEWSFGDGTVLTNVVTGVHKYFEAGEYTVKLTVKDKDGQSASVETIIVVGQIGGELDVLSIDVSAERSGQYQSSFNTSGLTRCEFRSWRYDIHGSLDTPCVINGLTEQYEWRWQHRSNDILHVSDLRQDYPYPGPHNDLYVLTVTEVSSETVRVDSLTITIPGDERKLAALTGVAVSSAPVPKFALNGQNCEFVGWDIVLSGEASTRCGTLLGATQFQWNWSFPGGGSQSGVAQATRNYPFDPQNPGESTDSATLTITETLVNPQGQNEDVSEQESIQFVIPAGPVTTIRRIDIELVDLEPDPRRVITTDPIWDLVDDGQGGLVCEFIGWDVFYDVNVLSGCGPMDEPSAQYEWVFDYGDGSQATDPVGPFRHRYLADPSSPGGRQLTTTLTVTDRNTGSTVQKTLRVDIPQLPSSVPEPCPDNAKR